MARNKCRPTPRKSSPVTVVRFLIVS
jgi:hypothetical protein